MTSLRGGSPTPRVGSDASAPAVLERVLFTPTTAVFASLAGVFGLLDVLHVQVPYVVQVVPFAVSVLLFGLPHGALDHLVPARLDHRITVRRSIASVVGLYALLGGATALLWTALPAAGFVLFIAVTWFHWGQGDLWLDGALRGTTPSRIDAALTVTVRGALPMLLPLVAHPDDYLAVFRMTTRLIDPASGAIADLLQLAPLRAAAAGLLAASIAMHLLLRHRLGDPVRSTLTEVVVLTAFFVAVPPVLAVGLYFTFWHAVRHIIRLELIESSGRAALERGELLPSFARFLRDALPVTLCAIAMLAGFAIALHDAGLATYLFLIAALTTPHTVIVTWMDHRRAGALRSSPHPLVSRAQHDAIG